MRLQRTVKFEPPQNGWKLPLKKWVCLTTGHWWTLRRVSSAVNVFFPSTQTVGSRHDPRARGVKGRVGSYLGVQRGSLREPWLPTDEACSCTQTKQWLYWQVKCAYLRWGKPCKRIAKCGHNDPFAIGRFIAEAERCSQMLDEQLASSGGPFCLASTAHCGCRLVPYCASAYWANVDISAMSHLLTWIEMLHQRPSFSTGLTLPFSRPAFYPSVCIPEEIEAEIARNAGQFAVISKSPS